jgi:hypothetical protein
LLPENVDDFEEFIEVSEFQAVVFWILERGGVVVKCLPAVKFSTPPFPFHFSPKVPLLFHKHTHTPTYKTMSSNCSIIIVSTKFLGPMDEWGFMEIWLLFSRGLYFVSRAEKGNGGGRGYINQFLYFFRSRKGLHRTEFEIRCGGMGWELVRRCLICMESLLNIFVGQRWTGGEVQGVLG